MQKAMKSENPAFGGYRMAIDARLPGGQALGDNDFTQKQALVPRHSPLIPPAWPLTHRFGREREHVGDPVNSAETSIEPADCRVGDQHDGHRPSSSRGSNTRQPCAKLPGAGPRRTRLERGHL